VYLITAGSAVTTKITSEFIERLITKVTSGFKGDVGVVPRQFLRQFVNILDLSADDEDFDPMIAEGFDTTTNNLTPEEVRLVEGLPYFEPEPEDIQGYTLEF
jgi:hypothetical protein